MNMKALYIAALSGLMIAEGAIAADAEDFHALAQRCAPEVPSSVMAPLVKVESGFNPYAMGVVGGRLERQARNKTEAVVTAMALQAAGLKFAAGIGQVYVGNWKSHGLTADTVFEPCQNIRAAAAIYKSCYDRALADIPNPALAEQAAYSCYYSNNFVTGFKADAPGQVPYVQKVLNSAAELKAESAPVVQPIAFIPNKPAGESTKPAKATVAKSPSPEVVDFASTVIPNSTPPVAVSASVPVQPPAQPVKAPQEAPAASKPQPNPYVYSPASKRKGWAVAPAASKPQPNPYVYLPASEQPEGASSALVY